MWSDLCSRVSAAAIFATLNGASWALMRQGPRVTCSPCAVADKCCPRVLYSNGCGLRLHKVLRFAWLLPGCPGAVVSTCATLRVACRKRGGGDDAADGGACACRRS